MKTKCLAIIIGLLFFGAGYAGAKEMPINPITRDVKEKIQESVRQVNQVDDMVAPKVKELEKAVKLYKPCEGKEEDRGCVEIKKQIGEKYSAVLESLADALPKIKKSVDATAKGLGKSIKAKTRRKDIKELYRNISKKSATPKARGPLSKKLGQLLKALGGSTKSSILELSLQTQADLIVASETLEFLDGKISQLSLMVELGQELPILSEEMAEVMKGVSELFGYDMDFQAGLEELEQESAYEEDDWRN